MDWLPTLSKFLKRYWVWVVLALFTVPALCLFVKYWRDPTKFSSVGALFGFLTTVLLVGITAEYVRTNQRSLRLLQAQWKQQQELGFRFGLRVREDKAQVWVANLGLRSVIITKAEVLSVDGGSTSMHPRVIVGSGRKKYFELSEKVWAGAKHQLNVEVTLHYESSTEQAQKTRPFTLYLDGHKVFKIRRGLHALWPVGCPKCNKFRGICMNTDSLRTLEEGRFRQQKLEADLMTSCPEHASPLILSMQDVTRKSDDTEG